MSRRLKLLPLLALAAASFTATAAFGADAGARGGSCFHTRELNAWKSPAPNVILLRAGANRIFRLDLRQGSDQLKYSDVHLVNRNIQTAWLCSPNDFDLILSDSHGVVFASLIVDSVRQLSPDEVAALPVRDRP